MGYTYSKSCKKKIEYKFSRLMNIYQFSKCNKYKYKIRKKNISHPIIKSKNCVNWDETCFKGRKFTFFGDSGKKRKKLEDNFCMF